MSNRDCSIVKDLLPLYIDEVASDETSNFIKEHLLTCEACQKDLDFYKKELTKNNQADDRINEANTLKKISGNIKRKNRLVFAFSTLLSAVVIILIAFYLVVPQYITYSDHLININENAGVITVELGADYTPVDGYNIYYSEFDNSYTIEAYTTHWGDIMSVFNSELLRAKTAVINPNKDIVSAVYYASNTQGVDDELIYGNNFGGGQVTLPRLFLGFYMTIAIACVVVCALLALIFYRLKKVQNFFVICLFMPASYLISQLLIIGLNTVTYTPAYDFIAILTLSVPLFLLMLLAYKIIK